MYKYVNTSVRFPAKSTHRCNYAFAEGQTNRTTQNQTEGHGWRPRATHLFLHHSGCLYLERPTDGLGEDELHVGGLDYLVAQSAETVEDHVDVGVELQAVGLVVLG